MGINAASQSELRTEIQKFLKKKIPTDISSDDARFPGMTGGMTTTSLKKSWDAKSYVTSCNSFAGWVAAQILSPKVSKLSYGVLNISLADNEVPGCWNWANTDEAIEYDLHPMAGDFYASWAEPTDPKTGKKFIQEFGHVGIVYDFDEDTQMWTLIQGGQGGPAMGKDWIKWSTKKFDRTKLTGWVDIAWYKLPDGPE